MVPGCPGLADPGRGGSVTASWTDTPKLGVAIGGRDAVVVESDFLVLFAATGTGFAPTPVVAPASIYVDLKPTGVGTIAGFQPDWLW